MSQSVYDNLAGRRILIVDDSKAITSLLGDVFESCGAEACVVNTGSAAMAHIRKGDIDLAILDLIMPDPNGWDLVRYMRDVNPELLHHTILLTGDRYHTVSNSYTDELGAPVIYKPFDLETLRAAVSGLLCSGDRVRPRSA